MSRRLNAPALGASCGLLAALTYAALHPALPTGAAPAPQIGIGAGQGQQICGQVTNYRAAPPTSPPGVSTGPFPGTVANTQVGTLTIGGFTLNIAPGAQIPEDVKLVGNNVCFTPYTNAQGLVTGGVASPNTGQPGAAGTTGGNQLCGPITDLQTPQGGNAGTITINGLTYAVAPGADLTGITVGMNTCLTATANNSNQITALRVGAANPMAPPGSTTVCGLIDEYQPAATGFAVGPAGSLPGLNTSPSGLGTNTTGRLTVNSTTYTIAPGVRPQAQISTGTYQCLTLIFTEIDLGGLTIRAIQGIIPGPSVYNVTHVCGEVTASTVTPDTPGGTITVAGKTYVLDPSVVVTGATVKPNTQMCFDFALTSGTTAVGVAAYTQAATTPTPMVPQKWTPTQAPASPTAPAAAATPAPPAGATPEDPDAATQPVVPAAPPGANPPVAGANPLGAAGNPPGAAGATPPIASSGQVLAPNVTPTPTFAPEPTFAGAPSPPTFTPTRQVTGTVTLPQAPAATATPPYAPPGENEDGPGRLVSPGNGSAGAGWPELPGAALLVGLGAAIARSWPGAAR